MKDMKFLVLQCNHVKKAEYLHGTITIIVENTIRIF